MPSAVAVREQARRLYEHQGKAVRTIAEALEVPKSTIARWAKSDGWVKPGAKPEPPTVPAEMLDASLSPEEAIAMAVNTGVAVVTGHRADIHSAKDICRILLQELRDTSVHAETIAGLIEQEPGSDMARAAMQRAVSLPERALTMVRLSGSMKTLVELERVAFGLDNKRPGEEKPRVRFQAFLGGREQAASHGVTLDG
ncbi:MAG: hypothetical protein ING91_19435 [Rhodocyclaceae bacterium]|nr:hypothetical protein [Rhodocyclaceae bacterium]MCA3116408.1 hypothetical protein [Rhodocyclaceae bacterium]MCA3129193.1 hypothetical protein [Rhodocyclaceae bacterium]